jgi:hypothetical protein
MFIIPRLLACADTHRAIHRRRHRPGTKPLTDKKESNKASEEKKTLVYGVFVARKSNFYVISEKSKHKH